VQLQGDPPLGPVDHVVGDAGRAVEIGEQMGRTPAGMIGA
jgi:hypothetical protein